MLFAHTCGLGVFMEDFKEKLLSLTSLLGVPKCGFHCRSCC